MERYGVNLGVVRINCMLRRTMFFKLKIMFLSIPFFHSSRICSLGIRLVRVCASCTESASRLLILSGSENVEHYIVWVYVNRSLSDVPYFHITIGVKTVNCEC